MARKRKTMDGNTAAAHVSYAFTEVAAIYPITPSSPMADYTDMWATQGRKNIFGQPVLLTEMQSEGGAAGAVHGSLQAGALTTTYTASQGLLLMIPNMYKMAGELLPGVIHVSARALASHALSIFGDHSDIYACRQTGYAMLCAGNVQETMDLGAVAHLAAIKGRVPFLHFFDGFRTSHEIQKVDIWDYDELAEMVDMDAIDEFRNRALNPQHPVIRGTAQNPDVFFQSREASNTYYEAIPAIVEDYMEQVNKRIGSNYGLFNYYGAKDAERVIIAMGSVCDTIEETIDYLQAAGEKVGLIKVRLYRPFSAKHLVAAIPETVKSISVLDRTKEPGALGEPLFMDVVASLRGTQFKDTPVFSGRYGLGSKDTTPADIIAVYRNEEKERFTIGIVDDVTNLSLGRVENPDTTPKSIISCKFWGLGSDGTVGANKNSIKIIGDHTDLNVQAYFDYDSKKSGGVTISHLRFGKDPIKATYLINKADFVACHTPAYLRKYNMVQDLKDGGTFLLNCNWTQEDMDSYLPGQVKKYMADHKIKFYTIDGFKIGKETGLGGRINTVLQSAFFQLANIIPAADAIQYMKDAATASYMSKGEEIVKMNHAAIDAGSKAIVEIKIPEAWSNCEYEDLHEKATAGREDVVKYVNTIQAAVNTQTGNDLPVSAFMDYADGTIPSGSAAFEKRGVAIDVPNWDPDNCIQCNFCAYVCPHAVIRPVVLDEEAAKNAPEYPTLPMTGLPDYKFAMTVSVMDCTGCGSCANVCPGKKGVKALTMQPIESQLDSQAMADYATKIVTPAPVFEKFKETSVKGSQFKKPLMEFSGACAGCGETPYARLMTQLFGDRMYIANATGCSSIWGGSSPASPYTVNKKGQGPAWANSLFEDNAEYGYGMSLAQKALRARVLQAADNLLQVAKKDTVKAALMEYLATKDSSTANGPATEAMITALEACDCDNADRDYILKNKDFASKKSQWIIGGDGWAYDIGFGGLDHVLAAGQDVNILVFDTEVYSNTGGQSSKATQTGAIAQFAAGGKEIKKKDLASIAMSYGYVYVASIAQGADYNQCIKAFIEAESYPGPSIIVAYAPCISHGIKGGMTLSQTEEKRAVQCGYWNLYRFDPRLEEEGKNPFQLDSKAPTASYQEFLQNEVRYSNLARTNPERAKELFEAAEREAKKKYQELVKRTV